MSFTIQPTGHTYFQLTPTWKKINADTSIARRFYASWEDALWDFMRISTIKAGETVLVPEFFCGDVVDNMEAHGLKAIWYPMDQFFYTDPAEFAQIIKKHTPAIVVILHSVGMENPLWKQKNVWLNELQPNTILIEDSVHRIVNPENIQLIHPRHIVMDSLRKVVPLAGSNVYGYKDFLEFIPTPAYKTILYQIQVFGWWFIFQFFLLGTQLPFGKFWNSIWNHLAEWSMLQGYEIIGDSQLSGRAWPPFAFLTPFLAYEKISTTKKQHIKIYESFLKDTPQKYHFLFPYDSTDRGQMRAFPVGLYHSHAHEILKKLRQHGILTRFELNTSIWSNRYKIIYLPIGPHVQDTDIEYCAQNLKKILEETEGIKT